MLCLMFPFLWVWGWPLAARCQWIIGRRMLWGLSTLQGRSQQRKRRGWRESSRVRDRWWAVQRLVGAAEENDWVWLLTLPTSSVPGCPANSWMNTAPILTKQPIPKANLFPILSAKYPDANAPKQPPIDDAVLKAICQGALTMYWSL